MIIYQDVPLFTSFGCIRDNDCRSCAHGEKWFDMEQKGHKYKALSRDCQIMMFDAAPYCIAAEAKDLQPDYFRMDFCYRNYTAEEVVKIVDKLLKFENITNCINGNFCNRNI